MKFCPCTKQTKLLVYDVLYLTCKKCQNSIPGKLKKWSLPNILSVKQTKALFNIVQENNDKFLSQPDPSTKS